MFYPCFSFQICFSKASSSRGKSGAERRAEEEEQVAVALFTRHHGYPPVNSQEASEWVANRAVEARNKRRAERAAQKDAWSELRAEVTECLLNCCLLLSSVANGFCRGILLYYFDCVSFRSRLSNLHHLLILFHSRRRNENERPSEPNGRRCETPLHGARTFSMA